MRLSLGTQRMHYPLPAPAARVAPVLMLVVWIVAGLVVLAAFGSVLFGLAGSLRRLSGELSALEREVQPVRTQVEQTAARAAAVHERSANDG